MSSPIQLALIARDEANLLPGCLQSVQDVVQRVVLVDTGSTDGTVDLATAAGAEVLHHPWTDDFAAARNVALRAMAPGWMLVLDADERLAPGAALALRAAIDAGDFEVGLLPVHNAARVDASAVEVRSGRARLGEPTLLARLFRVDPSLQWVGALHERVVSRDGRPLRQRAIDAPILHLGYAAPIMEEKAKHERNLRILRRLTAACGDDPVPWCYLARDARRAGEPAEAARAAEEAWVRLEAQLGAGGAPAPGGLPPAAVTLATLRADLQLGHGRLAEALQTVQTARGWGARHPNLDLMEATLRLAQAGRAQAGVRRRQAQGAEAAALRARRAHGVPQVDEVSAGATTWMAALRVGEARLLSGQDQGALNAFQEAAGLLPPDPRDLAAQATVAVRVGVAEVLTRHDPARALALLEPLLSTPFPDPWAVAAAACRALGKASDAQAFATQATARLGAGWLSVHRAELLRG